MPSQQVSTGLLHHGSLAAATPVWAEEIHGLPCSDPLSRSQGRSNLTASSRMPRRLAPAEGPKGRWAEVHAQEVDCEKVYRRPLEQDAASTGRWTRRTDELKRSREWLLVYPSAATLTQFVKHPLTVPRSALSNAPKGSEPVARANQRPHCPCPPLYLVRRIPSLPLELLWKRLLQRLPGGATTALPCLDAACPILNQNKSPPAASDSDSLGFTSLLSLCLDS